MHWPTTPDFVENVPKGETKNMAVDPDELDKLLVEELNELSIGDRERVLDEIHGISAADTFESGDKEALDRMQEELDRIYNDACENTGTADGVATRSGASSKRRRSLDRTAASTTSSDPLDAYIEARTGNSLMILDAQFLYGFLVVENLDPKRAALRMTKYLKFIRELYGKSDVLYRPIFIDDMHPDAHEEFLNGPLQILPERDSSGRRIFVYLRDFSEKVDNKYTVRNMNVRCQNFDVVLLKKSDTFGFCFVLLSQKSIHDTVTGIYVFSPETFRGAGWDGERDVFAQLEAIHREIGK